MVVYGHVCPCKCVHTGCLQEMPCRVCTCVCVCARMSGTRYRASRKAAAHARSACSPSLPTGSLERTAYSPVQPLEQQPLRVPAYMKPTRCALRVHSSLSGLGRRPACSCRAPLLRLPQQLLCPRTCVLCASLCPEQANTLRASAALLSFVCAHACACCARLVQMRLTH